ncbi:MAG: transcription antitermination factor NusB [Lachnospiraceae bacterium]|nr:transcription antitermination factor NusB [Lachnospiraceae bacterium]
MSRREVREQIFKILFRAEFYAREELAEQLDLSVVQMEASETDIAYIKEKTEDICRHLDEIDALINAHAEKWKTGRMAKAELAIIRLAVYEMNYEEKIPVSVAINEAVELAKRYGDEHGSGFVNGILAKLVPSASDSGASEDSATEM